ncbi:shikimate kinase [Rhodococcus sp. WMMA185]|uniref:shikimate kinase n=1 Tax=Rhodococcus sp. WMMA185 TaxID=679318 RepID=UPI000878A983|nr:shikimate kinase [Rhodococcus sp. WMMA185]AOW94569.1 shikimate kinase [Rhodococcus sp. WMMA185]
MAPRAVLVGPPGAGKSTIGKRLARALDLPLLDTDVAIEEEAGRTIADIFGQDGEPAFRALEEKVVRQAIESCEGVVSLGGGAILSERTRELLQGHTVVYLEISVAEGLKRTRSNVVRPLLAGDARQKYTELMRVRRPLYEQVASIRIRTNRRSPGRVVQDLVEKLTTEQQDGAE